MGKTLQAETALRSWPTEGWTRVPFWVYTDPAIFEREMDKFFYGPTWNYVAVHASGVGALVEDAARVRALLADLVRAYEGAGGTAWSLDALPEDYMAGMQRGIVAFEIPIDRLEGKAKLSQNRDAVDQGRTREALGAADDPLARAVAAMMAGDPPR